MSDQELRALERRWRETGACDDEACYLRAQVRSGELSAERVRLAACLEHPAAVLVEGPQTSAAPAHDTPGKRLVAWAEHLSEQGVEVAQRVSLAAARRRLGILQAALDSEEPGGPLQACVTEGRRRLDVADAYVLSQDPSLIPMMSEPVRMPDHPVLGPTYEHMLNEVGYVLIGASTGSWTEWAELVEPEVSAVRSAIQEDLIPWALDRFDPLELSLAQIRIASPCPIEWDDMQGDDRVRFCSDCELNVYNLADLPREEAERLVREKEGRACVQLFERADGSHLAQDCTLGAEMILAPYRPPRRLLRGVIMR